MELQYADPVFLVEPTCKEFNEALWDEQGSVISYQLSVIRSFRRYTQSLTLCYRSFVSYQLLTIKLTHEKEPDINTIPDNCSLITVEH